MKEKQSKNKVKKQNKTKQTFRYIKEESIINGKDEYNITNEEYCNIYKFYVTYSMCGTQSAKKRTLKDYGWKNYDIENVNKKLKSFFDIDDDKYIFTDEDNLTDCFNKNELNDGVIRTLDYERFVIGKTSEDNKIKKLLYRMRDGFAHGRFLLKYSSKKEKMIVIQDNDQYNVTDRIVLKLDTILGIIKTIDKNSINNKLDLNPIEN